MSSFNDAVSAERLERAAAALVRNGFAAEVLPGVAEARDRVAELVPAGASVFTGASETLRLSGIEADVNAGGRYQGLRAKVLAMDRGTQADEIRRLMSTPDVAMGSVHAVTETGSLVVASATGSQLPAFAGGARHVVLIVGAQKIVPDLATALRRVEEHSLVLESERAQAVYGVPSVVGRMLIMNAEVHPGRVTVLLLREAIGF